MAERTARRYVAIDLGAESGRVIVGRLSGERVELDHVARFANRRLWLPDGLHWNLPQLLGEVLDGLAAAASGGQIHGIGVDAWGCDYGLLDRGHRLLGLPYHYRDERTAGDVLDRAHARISRADLYARTGIQTMPINTSFQLFSEAGGPALANAEAIALVPDLLALWLTGTLVNETTIASTTGLLEAGSDRWATDVVQALGLPAAPFLGSTVPSGTDLGPVLDGHRERAGAAVGAPVRTVAGHDTASAFAAAPLADEHAAVLSSGTWSLLGLELPVPELGEDAAACNLTNERGVLGTTRLLRNVMGLWLLQECRRAWQLDPSGYGELKALADAARPDVPVFDPDSEALLRGGDMPALIAEACTAAGQAAPSDRGELVRSILVSLACAYRFVLEQLMRVTGRQVDVVHVVGGGARNELLCQLTADICERPVLAGPVEATALGNVLVQALGAGDVDDLAQVRAMAARSASPRRYEPVADGGGSETYERFLAVTGVAPDRATERARTAGPRAA